LNTACKGAGKGTIRNIHIIVSPSKSLKKALKDYAFVNAETEEI